MRIRKHICQSVIQIVLLLFAHSTLAGQVYGTVVRDGNSAGNVNVKIDCPNATANRNTDSSGSYSLYINATGNCQLSVNGAGPLSIRVYPNDVRYDLQLSGNDLRIR